MSTEKKPLTKVVTGPVRLSYAAIWEPRAVEDGGPKKYSGALLIPKKDKETIKKLNAAIEAAIEDGISKKWGGKRPVKLKLPLRDGDEEKPDDPVYAGMYWINATSSTQPGVLDVDKNEMLDKTKLYSGCWIKADINAYAFDTKGNKGVAIGLNNILKWKDDTALSGKEAASVAFKDVEANDEDDDL